VSQLLRALVAELADDPEALERLRVLVAKRGPERERPGATNDWLTLRQAATHLGIGYSTAKRHAAEGAWPVEREGGRVYVRRGDLDAWRCGSA
jgi:excisionase family DNA binding protein